MAHSLISNKKNLAVTVHVSASNSTLVIAGGTGTSNVAKGDEVLTGASITQLFWGTDTGAIVVKRGANVVVTCTQSGHMDFAAAGMSLTKDMAANLVVELPSANAFVLLEMQKVGTLTANSEYFQN